MQICEITKKIKIIPKFIIYQNNYWTITKINKNNIIHSYLIILDSELKILKIKSNYRHPNIEPNSKEFCISTTLIGKKYTTELNKFIIEMFKIYNMDSVQQRGFWNDLEYIEEYNANIQTQII